MNRLSALANAASRAVSPQPQIKIENRNNIRPRAWRKVAPRDRAPPLLLPVNAERSPPAPRPRKQKGTKRRNRGNAAPPPKRRKQTSTNRGNGAPAASANAHVPVPEIDPVVVPDVNSQGRPVVNKCLWLLAEMKRLGYTSTRAKTIDKYTGTCDNAKETNLKKALRWVLRATAWHAAFVRAKGRAPTKDDVIDLKPKQMSKDVKQYVNSIYFKKGAARAASGGGARNGGAGPSRRGNRSGPAAAGSREWVGNGPTASRGKKQLGAAYAKKKQAAYGNSNAKSSSSSSSNNSNGSDWRLGKQMLIRRLEAERQQLEQERQRLEQLQRDAAAPPAPSNGHIQMYIARLQAMHGNRWPIEWERQQLARMQRESNARANARGRPFRMTSRPNNW